MRQIKQMLRKRLPFLARAWQRMKTRLALRRKTPIEVFTDIYQQNKWGDKDSVSGPGSRLDRTDKIRKVLPLLISKYDFHSILDIPCGDFYWMKTVDLKIQYIGADIVADLVKSNQGQYGIDKRKFVQLDLIRDSLPQVDLVFCRDCLVHLSVTDIFRVLSNIKSSGSMYLLTTTFIERVKNANILTGEWRPINLQLPPFKFPAPIELIDETAPYPNYYDKHLGLWKITDFP
jgi:hypothetical protein